MDKVSAIVLFYVLFYGRHLQDREEAVFTAFIQKEDQLKQLGAIGVCTDDKTDRY